MLLLMMILMMKVEGVVVDGVDGVDVVDVVDVDAGFWEAVWRWGTRVLLLLLDLCLCGRVAGGPARGGGRGRRDARFAVPARHFHVQGNLEKDKQCNSSQKQF